MLRLLYRGRYVKWNFFLAEILEKALESNWLMLLEDIGLWMPADVVNKDNNNKPDNEPELGMDFVNCNPQSVLCFHFLLSN